MNYSAFLILHGDPLEQYIASQASENLPDILSPYSEVWAEHVYVRRIPDNPSRVPPEWMDFAGSHYTALIRIHQAFRYVEQLKSVCESEFTYEDGEKFLDLHSYAAAFWWNIGSAIDNLGAAFSDAPCTNLKKGCGSRWLRDEYPKLSEGYDRRTQFVHSRVVPIKLNGGMPVFGFRFLGRDLEDNDSLPKYTDWEMEYQGRDKLIEDFYDDSWLDIRSEFSAAWQHLNRWLKDTDLDRPKFDEAITPPENSSAGYSGGTFNPQQPRSSISGVQIPRNPPSG